MKIQKITARLTAACLLVTLASCEEDSLSNPEVPFAPYVVSLGITSAADVTTYYVVTTEDLMNGTINAVGKGIEQNGYRDYDAANQTIFSIGGLGVTEATEVVRGGDGYLKEGRHFTFTSAPDAFIQIEGNKMLGLELPANKTIDAQMTFYTVDINSFQISQQTPAPVFPMNQMEWPSITGMCYGEGRLYVTYLGMNPNTWATPYTDTTYVAVYKYPEMTFETLMKDTRTGPAGSWNAFNGIFPVESGDMYIMSSSSIGNGYSQSTKTAGFLRIPKGQTAFDDYFFDFGAATGGLRPAHIKYVGDGLVFAEVSTLNPQPELSRWNDPSLKCCIIDLNNKTVRDIPEIPVHDGGGARRFAVLVEDGYVYCPVKSDGMTYLYRIDPKTATAERGAKVSGSFIAGFFRLD